MRCAHCNGEAPGGFRFCGLCGRPLPATVAKPEAPGPERRQISVLFCDLVGSMSLSERLDPEDLRDVLGRYQACAASAIQRYDGELAQLLGDGILAYFGFPRAHEDDACRAIRAGLEILARVEALNASIERDKGVRIATRAGVHTGLVVAGEVGGGPWRETLAVGETPNLAARLQGIAEENALVVSAATHRLVRGFFACESRGFTELKGLTAPIEVFRVLGESGAQGRLEAAPGRLTALVGRTDELARLVMLWNEARAGTGRIVLVSGEAGIGKSRLLETFAGRTGVAPSARLRYYCSEYQATSPLHPIARQLERAAEFAPSDSASERARKVEALLAPAEPTRHELALVNELLGLPEHEAPDALEMSPERKREITFALLLRVVESLSARTPVLLCFEDAHWSDPSTLELLDRLAARISRMAVLAIVTCRPDFRATWMEAPGATAITVGRLDAGERKELIGRVARGAELGERIMLDIAERSDGIPLFVEELTSSTLESTGASAEVPVTLQSSLQARLDRLGAAAREVAQVGAAIGRQFSYALLAAIAPRGREHLVVALEALGQAGLLTCRGTVPEATYVFKHALVQDAAYATLLRARRRELHGAIADELGRAASSSASGDELLAHHLTQAGKEAEAIRAWKAAARRSVARGAFAEAEAQLRAGLKLLAKLPEGDDALHAEVALQNALGNVLIARYGYTAAETLVAFERARTLAARLDDPGQGLRALWNLGTALLFAGRPRAVLEMMDEAAPLVEKNGHLDARLAFSVVHGCVLFEMGRLDQAFRQLEHTLAMDSEPARDRDRTILYGQSPRISALGHLAIVSLLLGHPARSRTQCEQGVREAEALSHKPTLCLAHSLACRRSWLANDTKALEFHAQELRRLAEEQATRHWLALAQTYRGWSLVESGELEDGIGCIRAGLDAYGKSGSRSGRPMMLLVLGRGLARAGRVEEAHAALGEALECSGTEEEQWIRALVLCEAAALGHTRADGARAAYREAAALAHAQGAKLFEERAEFGLRRMEPELSTGG